jgi:hypothetical protein
LCRKDTHTKSSAATSVRGHVRRGLALYTTPVARTMPSLREHVYCDEPLDVDASTTYL